MQKIPFGVNPLQEQSLIFLFFSDTTLDLLHFERMLRNRTLNSVDGLSADLSDFDVYYTEANETITARVQDHLSEQVRDSKRSGAQARTQGGSSGSGLKGSFRLSPPLENVPIYYKYVFANFIFLVPRPLAHIKKI